MIKLENISKSFNDKIVLDNINLEIKNGEFVSITGNSGRGKSTLLNIIGLLEKPDSGNVIIDNKNIKYDNEKLCNEIRGKEIGFVFQFFHLIPKTTVKFNLEVGLIYNKSKNTYDIKKILEELKIENLINTKVDVLSGGEKQRVAFARAIINNPKILICDEPTGNLDEMNSDIIMDLLKKENQKGRTIIVITHDMRVARQADRIIEL